MRQLLTGLALLVALNGCHSHGAGEVIQPREHGSATFTTDSAVFVFSMPGKLSWSWSTPDTSRVGTPQYSWSALGQDSADRAFFGEGVGLMLLRPIQDNHKNGTLGELVQDARTRALLRPPSGLDVAHVIEPEPALSAVVRKGRVVLTLDQSGMLRRLLAEHPRTMQLMFRVGTGEEEYADTVAVKYR